MSAAGSARVEIEYADFVDAACPDVGGRTARQAYDEQKGALRELLRRLADTNQLDAGASEAAACLLHNLAGTAAYFGERALGDGSAELELRVRHADDCATLHRACDHMLTLLKAA